MSIAAIALNGLLAVLLIAALAFGWRLDRRLKALKDSHDGFAKAVLDLDVAAARAEQGLADLRAATDEAAETLADRIDKARALAVRLEKGLGAAPAPDILDGETMVERPEGRISNRANRAPMQEAPRSRARVDDDLFEPTAARLKTILGGRS